MYYFIKTICIAFLAVKVSSWGNLGHSTIAYLASRYMNQTDLDFVLRHLDFEDISDAANWADEVSGLSNFNYSRPWHYINVDDSPPDLCEISVGRDRDAEKGDVVGAISNHTAILRMNDTNASELSQVLAFLIHWIGDVHQPLHVEALGRGGVDFVVDFDSRRTNLHSVWDFEILNKYRKGNTKTIAKQWADELYLKDTAPRLNLERECSNIMNPTVCVMQWAIEANSWVCKYVLQNLTESLTYHDLGNEYYTGAIPIIEDLVGKAGRRLGAWLTRLAVHHRDQATKTPITTFQLPLSENSADQDNFEQ